LIPPATFGSLAFWFQISSMSAAFGSLLISTMSFAILACGFSCCLAADSSSECIDNGMAPERRHALLQTGQIKSITQLARGSADFDELNEMKVLLSASTSSKGIGATAPLTEAGYQEVAATCCNLDMAAFTLRLVEDLSLEVCDQGGLSGLVIWYTCGNASSLDALKSNLLASQPPVKCAFVAPAGACPTKDPSCKGVFDPAAFEECTPTATTTPLAITTVASTTTAAPNTTCTTLAELTPEYEAGSCVGRCSPGHRCCTSINRCVAEGTSCDEPPETCIGTCFTGWACCPAQGNQCLKAPLNNYRNLCMCVEDSPR